MTKPVIGHLLPPYNAFPPVIPAGTELRVEQVGLRQTRYQALVLCGAFPGQMERERIGNMEVRRIRFSRLYRRLFQKITRLDPLPYGERMWSLLMQEGTALLHVHNEPKLLAGLAAHLRRTPLPVVAHIANQKPFLPEVVPLVTRFVACSEFMAKWLIDSYGIEKEKVEVIHTGVDVKGRPPRWQVSASKRQELRHRWGVKDDDLVFVFGGRLVQEKGVAEMLDAFEQLAAGFPRPVHLLVAGNVRESNDPKNEKTNYGRAMVSRMASMEKVTWVGSLRPDEMHDFLVAGDVFLLPSLWDDPYPTVMLEAAAAGIPIVAAARGGVTEFLRDCPGHCFVADPSNPADLAAEMRRYAESPDLRENAGRWLRHIIENRFDWSRVTDEFESLYDRLLLA